MKELVGMDAAPEPLGVQRVRVAFIAGTSWSGSTVLEQTLGQLDGCVSIGEPFWVWDRNWPQMLCECGLEFRACAFWQTVLDEAYGAASDVVRSQVRARSRGFWRHSILPALTHSSSVLPGPALAELAALVQPLYQAVARVAGASTVVDASKAGLWGITLAHAEAIDLRVVHLVRDPAGFVDSDGRRRDVPYPLGATRPPRPAMRSLITWLWLHTEAEILARRDPESVVVLYEDLVRSPQSTIGRVARAIGLDGNLAGIFENDELLVRRTGHAIGGNPRRPRPGNTAIKPEAVRYTSVAPFVRHTLVPLAAARYRHYRGSVGASSDERPAVVRSDGLGEQSETAEPAHAV